MMGLVEKWFRQSVGLLEDFVRNFKTRKQKHICDLLKSGTGSVNDFPALNEM
jgi:hypothetical protein